MGAWQGFVWGSGSDSHVPQSIHCQPPLHSTVRMPAFQQQVSKKRKFVADGVFRAELDEFLRRELGEDGYAG